jgi:two-component system sensor histidine kinase/response regulator
MIKRILVYSIAAAMILHFRAGAGISKHGTVTPAEIDSLNERAYRQIHGNLAKTLVLLSDAEQLCIKTNYKRGLAVNYLYQAEVFNQRGYAKRAQILYTHAIELSRQNKDYYNIARAEEHLSSIQRNHGNLIEAERLLNNSLSILSKLNKPVDIVNIQQRIGLLKEKQKKHSEALKMYETSCRLASKIGYLYGEKKSYYDRAELYADINNADSAIYYYNKTLHIDTLTKDQFGKALTYIGLSGLYLKQGEYAKSIAYAESAQLNADSVKAHNLQVEAIEILLNAYRQKNDLLAVTQWQQKLLEVERANSETNKNDAVLFVEVLKEQQEKQLAIQKKISEIQKESQTKSVVLLCILIIMLIVVLLIFSISYNYKKAKVYAAELNEKNRQIEEHADSVARLNKKILGQNNILEEDNNLKSKLLSIISHDLRHPLTNTKSIIDLINLNLVSNQEAGHLYQHLEAQYTRAINLLDNLLYWIKSQVNDGRVEKLDVNLHRMVDALVEEQKLQLQKKEIQVLNLISSDLEIFAENEVLKIVFRNLLTNAIKFTNHYGAIQFSSELNGGELKITVRDNGVGMNPDTLSRIQGLSHYTSRGTAGEDGSGMGLMLIRDLIKKIDGTLTIESKLGEGSTFTVSLTHVSAPFYHTRSIDDQPV